MIPARKRKRNDIEGSSGGGYRTQQRPHNTHPRPAQAAAAPPAHKKPKQDDAATSTRKPATNVPRRDPITAIPSKKNTAANQQRPLSANWKQLQATLPSKPVASVDASAQPAEDKPWWVKKSEAKKRKRVQEHEQQKEKEEKEEKQQQQQATKPAPVTVKTMKDVTWNNSDTSLTRMLALDCEMVGVGIDGVESVLARVSVVNQHGALVYDAHVQTVEKVVDYRTKYSGIRPADLKQRAGAKSFKQVQHEVSELIKDRVVIGHGLENDFAALMLSHPWALTRDSARWKPLMRAKRKPHALRFLVRQILGIQIQQGEHDPAEDARAALLLYNHLKKDWERHVKTVLQRTKKKVKKTAPKTTATVSRASSARVNNDDDSDEDDDAGQLDLNLPSDEDEDL